MITIINKTTEAAMIALFLQSEWQSPERWRPTIEKYLIENQLPSTIITQPNTDDSQENVQRLAIFDSYRPYTVRQNLFASFPQDVCWYSSMIGLNDLRRIRYINYSYWNALSQGTRLAEDAVATIAADKRIYDVPNNGFRHLATLLQNGVTFPPLIVVGISVDEKLVVLEGHARLTAYMIASEYLPASLPIMLGLSPHMGQWTLF